MSARMATCAASTLPSSFSMRARASSSFMSAAFVGEGVGAFIVSRKPAGTPLHDHQAEAQGVA